MRSRGKEIYNGCPGFTEAVCSLAQMLLELVTARDVAAVLQSAEMPSKDSGSCQRHKNE